MEDTQNFYSGGSTIREVIRATLQNANSISNMQDILQPWNGDFVVNGNITVANHVDTDTLQADKSITTQSIHLGLKDTHNGRLRAVDNMTLFVESAPGGGNYMSFGKNSFTTGTRIEWDSLGENGQIRFRGSGGTQGTIVSHDSITMRNGTDINTRLTNDSKIILYEDEDNSFTIDGSTDELKFTRNETSGDTEMLVMTKESVTVNSELYIHDNVVVENGMLNLKANDRINMQTFRPGFGFVTHLVMNQNGNVGIGFNPDPPQYLLDVNDTVRVGNKGRNSQLFLGGSSNELIYTNEAGLGHHEVMSYALKHNKDGRTDINANADQIIQMNIDEVDKIRISDDTVKVNSDVFITERLAIGNVTSPSFVIDTNNIQGDETTIGGDVRFRSTSKVQRIRQGANVDGVEVGMTTLAVKGEDGTVVMGQVAEFVNQPNITGDLELRSLNNIRIQTDGSNDRVYITQGGNVGIGTTTPTELLDVNGNINCSSIQVGEISSNDTIEIKTNSFVRMEMTMDGGIRLPSANATITGHPINNPKLFAGEIMGSNGLNSSRGNLRLKGGNNRQACIELLGFSTEAAIKRQLRFWTWDSERMRIIDEGRVGINTTTPIEQLHVVGNAKITGGVLPFTGAHVGELSETIENASVLQLGRIMSIESVSNIDINNNSYVVNVCGDTRVPFGVYSGVRFSSPNTTTRIIRMNALGEGGVLIRRFTCGNIQAGDYLVSDADGYATKKDDQTIDRFVVGKALCEPSTWTDEGDDVQLLPVVYLCG